MRRLIPSLALILAAGVTAARAEPPRVVVDIAPAHALVAQVMEAIGTPELLLGPGVSPHHYTLRPSEARMLSRADIVFWIGAAQSPWLEQTLATLADKAEVIALLSVPGTRLMTFDAADGHGHAGHDDHGDDHGDEGNPGRGDDHDHDHDHADAQDHADGHDHAPGAVDPHAWLDPDNAAHWLGAIAEVLAESDPANADAYRENAAEGQAALATLTDSMAAQLSGLTGGFVTFHDAYRYFESHFGLNAHGALSPSDATDPGPARLSALRDRVQADGVACLFSEPQLNPRQAETLARDLNLRLGTLDPIGAGLTPGPGLYAALMQGMADALSVCLRE